MMSGIVKTTRTHRLEPRDVAQARDRLQRILEAIGRGERHLIGQRTRDALAVRKAQGVRLGGLQVLPAELVERISRQRLAGATLQAIADQLNEEGVPTAHGGARWWPSTLGKVLRPS